MLFGDFIDTVQTKSGENLYLTTQYRDEEEEEGDLDDGILYQMLHEYCPPPLPPMLHSFPQRPSLLGNLVPQQVNLWIGNSNGNGTSSGLHHDFHDNLYLLLHGHKRFTLFSPADAFHLYTYGNISKVHPNGLINYSNRESTRSDGASEHDLAQHKIELLEAILDNMDEDAIAGGPERAEIEAQLAAAEEAALDLVDPFDADGDDFDDMMDDIMDDAEYSDEDEESEEETAKKSRKASSTKSDKSAKSQKNKCEESVPEKEESEGEEDDAQEEQEVKKEEPNSFSRISVAELHNSTTKETRNKFPLLKKGKRTTVNLNPGEMLFLPSGWFHEVTSSNGTVDAASPHIAFNYWMHPPATNNYANPYEDNYWQSQWKEMVELISDIDATIRTGKRPLAVEQELDEKEYIPHAKRRKTREK